MDFKTALGFLGLLSILVLIIIYIIKPNYQQKIISSTLVWKLSLKYRKKKIPLNISKQLLIFICQVLVFTLSAFILAQPFLVNALNESEIPKIEKVIIIDASASMLAVQQNGTRFENAVAQAKALGEQVLNDNGLVTVILAGKEAAYVTHGEDNEYTAFRTDAVSIDLFSTAMDNLSCTYGSADIDGAMILAQDILILNDKANMIFYTATTYNNIVGSIEIKDVSLKDSSGVKTEWNAAILNCTSTFSEGYYTFEVEAASYNADSDLTVFIEVSDANLTTGEGKDALFLQSQTIVSSKTEACARDGIIFVTFSVFDPLKDNNDWNITSFNSVEAYIIVDDTFPYDNNFSLYGGRKETIKILYASTVPHDFLRRSLVSVQSALSPRWNIEYDVDKFANNPSIEGYDFYIFEHGAPSRLPTDGIVLLIDPVSPANTNISFANPKNSPFFAEGYSLLANNSNPITKAVDPSKVLVTRYSRITSHPGFESVMYYSDGEVNDPILLVKNESNAKIAVLAFDLHFSYLPISSMFPTIMLNLFNYFLPSTVVKTINGVDKLNYIYDVGETMTLNARGEQLEFSGQELSTVFTDFPHSISLDAPGIYIMRQELLSKKIVTEKIYVKIPTIESDFSRVATFSAPFLPKEDFGLDILVYLASAVVAFLFIERLLHFNEEI